MKGRTCCHCSSVSRCLIMTTSCRMIFIGSFNGFQTVPRTNIELMRHIAEIRCSADGTIVLRGTHLGLFAGAVELLNDPSCAGRTPETLAPSIGKPVRRRRLRARELPSLLPTTAEHGGGNGSSTAPAADAFSHLAEEFLWSETFTLEAPRPWYQAHAEEVKKAYEAQAKKNQTALARHFGVTKPTIRAALRYNP
jgi:hypothetical protein